jgi:epoxyqueuosine reductase QueG
LAAYVSVLSQTEVLILSTLLPGCSGQQRHLQLTNTNGSARNRIKSIQEGSGTMSVKDSFKGISRRSFVKVAVSASAVAIAAPVALTVERRSKELEIEKRIADFIDNQRKTFSQYIFDEAPGANPRPRLGNGLKYSQFNTDGSLDNVQLFDSPVVAFASASDPLFNDLKKQNVVGPNHLNPEEWLLGAKTVISYFYPFVEEVRASNRQPGLPSKKWLAAKASAEIFIHSTSYELTKFLAGLGVDSIVPDHDPRFKMVRYGNTSAPGWSERHVGWVAGLGTFGLHKSLITEKGSAGRIGSVITTLELKPTVRAYKGKNDYCPYYVDGSCVACIDRCSGHAVSKTNNDQATLCAKYCKETVVPAFAPVPYRGGCGKCLNAVPCENRIPASIKRSA